MAHRPDIIVIVSDSLRQDHVGLYGGEDSPAKTPNIDRLLQDCVVFDNMYPHGLPTIPVRTEWMTGMGTLMGRSWQPLEKTDVTVAEILRHEGYLTTFITDTYHYFKPNMNFHQGFMEWHWIRGQEYDAWRTAMPKERRVDDYCKDSFPDRWWGLLEVICQNLEGRHKPEDFPCHQTFAKASEWLRLNASSSDPFFLWVETFDPHEPWTPPEGFDVYGDPKYTGKDYILPPGGPASLHFTPEEIERIRSLYAGEVHYVDAMIGKFLDVLQQVGRYDDALIFFLSDHGHPLADHGKFLKGPDRMYSEQLKVPFGFKLPGGDLAGTRTPKLAQFPDVLPTLLDAAGLGNDVSALQGSSLLPLVRGKLDTLHSATITGFHHGIERCIRDEVWSLVLRPWHEPDELFNLEKDPKEQDNVIDEHHDVVRRLASAFGSAFSVASRPIKGLQGTFEVADTPAG